MEAARSAFEYIEAEMDQHIDLHLSGSRALTGIDFSKFSYAPLRRNTTNGHQSTLAKWIGKTKSARSIVKTYGRKGGIDFTGTADHVAGMMQEVMKEVGGDGFLFFNSYFDRRYVIEVGDGLNRNCSAGV